MRRHLLAVAAALGVLLALVGCGPTAAEGSAPAGPPTAAGELRLGFFGNVTHAPALVGVGRGLFARQLGATRLTTQVFNAGPAAVEALNAGAIDAAYLGPSPAINAFVKSDGRAVRIVAGATSGGAQLVVRPGISSPADLEGTNLATPQLGGTQDVALRAWLRRNGLESPLSGGGDVRITPTENAQTLKLFTDGRLDGAWLPEPWASRLVLEAGAKVLVDERTLWPRGRFLTTHLVVAPSFLERHPQTVAALLRGHVAALDWAKAHPGPARALVNEQIGKATGKPLPAPVITRAYANIELTPDPLASTLGRLLEDGVSAGVTREASLDGIYDLRPLNAVLQRSGRPPLSAAGLGEE